MWCGASAAVSVCAMQIHISGTDLHHMGILPLSTWSCEVVEGQKRKSAAIHSTNAKGSTV